MPKRGHGPKQATRTVLEQMIRERRETFEEFAEYAEKFARDRGEPGTLSVRHLQRLVAGRKVDGTSLGPLRPATARLLERILGLNIDELLSPPNLMSDIAPSTVQALRVAIAIVVHMSDVLIVCRRGDAEHEISWQFPAGVVRPGVLPETVAVRETFGETRVHCAVQRRLGSRVHPVTNVICDYLLCEYLTGFAENADVIENAGVSWVRKTDLSRFIPVDQIFPPVLDALAVRCGEGTNCNAWRHQ